jgi:3-phosphoshikimate 1-carboxyvinyltransferase
MSTLTVTGGGRVRGRVRVPGDKSISHRALLLAHRARGTSVVRGLSNGDDVARTRDAILALGAEVEGDRITGGRFRAAPGAIDVGNSGTGIRLLAGHCATMPWRTVLRGDESIDRRPMDRVADPLRLMGATIDDTYPPLTIDGGALHGIDYTVPMASAQVKGCVLLAGVDADGETVVREKVATRPHTEEMLAAFGADIEVDGLVIRLRRSQLEPFEIDVPGDPSQAAFWIVAACIVPGSEIVVEDIYLGPARAGFLDVLRRMGAEVDVDGSSVAARTSGLQGTEVRAEEIPSLDEVPILAVAATAAEGSTTFRDVGELRVKESDRLAAVVTELGAMGASVEASGDDLVVHGGKQLSGAAVRSHADHRIAMALAIAGLAAEGSTRIEGWEAVPTSYPEFERDLRTCVS